VGRETVVFEAVSSCRVEMVGGGHENEVLVIKGAHFGGGHVAVSDQEFDCIDGDGVGAACMVGSQSRSEFEDRH
jgi:hypothetical protein